MKKDSYKPTARKRRLLIEQVEAETLVYDLDSHQAHCLNPTVAAVWRHCDGRASVGALVQATSVTLLQPVDEAVVELALVQLGTADLLENPLLPDPSATSGRRALLKTLGTVAASAVLLPAVLTILAPTAADASTCFGVGHACTTTFQCCNGLVCSAGSCIAP